MLQAERHERPWGEIETEVVPVHNLILLTQTRDIVNADQSDLEASLLSPTGLLNQVDVVKLDQPCFETYMEFVNRTWGSKHSLEDFENQVFQGMYYTVGAGHSRTISIKNIIRHDPTASDMMRVKIHPAKTPEEIIKLQIDENIHTKPRVEREAQAIVEAYMWGLEQGHYTTRAEFLERFGSKVSKGKLDKALAFAELPPAMREFVFAGHIPFSVALELGDGLQQLQQFEAVKMGVTSYDSMSDEEHRILSELVSLRINEIIMHLSTTKNLKTPSKGCAYIESLRKTWQAEIDKSQNSTHEVESLTLFTAADQQRQYLSRRVEETTHQLNSVAGLTGAEVVSLLDIAERLTNIDTAAARRKAEQAIDTARRMLGARGMGDYMLINGTSSEPSFEDDLRMIGFDSVET